MARISAQDAGGQNVVAFLDMIAWSEVGADLLAKTDDGYNVVVGSTPDMPIVFLSYADHPHVVIEAAGGIPPSSAMGRYQILRRYWDIYKPLLGATDFGPLWQDRYAIRQLKESGALPAVLDGRFEDAVGLCAHIWASLAGSQYGQHTNSMEVLKSVYEAKGGTAI